MWTKAIRNYGRGCAKALIKIRMRKFKIALKYYGGLEMFGTHLKKEMLKPISKYLYVSKIWPTVRVGTASLCRIFETQMMG